MYALHQAKQEAVTALKKAIGKGVDVRMSDLSTPPNPEMGDLAFPCFVLAKQQKMNPAEIARTLAAKIGPTPLIASIQSEGPYVNFVFNKQTFAKAVLADIAEAGNVYGHGTSGKGVKVMIEYAQPNTLKEFHIGHIRNALYGQAVINVARASGYDVVATSYINDLGSNVAKILWWMEKKYPGVRPEKDQRNQFLQKLYVEATAYEKEHEEAKEEISQTYKQLEAHEGKWHDLWKETRQWSLDAFKQYFDELNVEPDVWYFESDVLDDGKKMVQKLLTDGVAKKSDGAVIVDLTDEDLGVLVLLKSDGTSLYATRDLPLALKKEADHNLDRQIFITDDRQSLYFEQIFSTLKKFGFTKQMIHLGYGLVRLPGATMSSREGTIVLYEDLRDDMFAHLQEETKSRHQDWSQEKVDATAAVLRQASMAFMMLRQDPKSLITFDKEEAMSFEGFTGPYVLYTVARIARLQEKAPKDGEIDMSLLNHPLEHQLISQLAEYPDVVAHAANSFNVANIAAWAFDTAKLFSEYYHQVRIIDPEQPNQTFTRVSFAQAIRYTLSLAMEMLGIDVLDEM